MQIVAGGEQLALAIAACDFNCNCGRRAVVSGERLQPRITVGGDKIITYTRPFLMLHISKSPIFTPQNTNQIHHLEIRLN
jgi:hypothetical protein